MPEYKLNKDGYYRATIVTGHIADDHGKLRPKRETIRSKSLQDFKEKLRQSQNMRDCGYNFDAKNMTVQQWAEQWYKVYKKPNVRSGSQQNYEIDLKKHIYPAIGHILLSEIKPVHLQNLLNQFEGKSTSHARKIKLTLEQIFRRAYVDGMILRNPAETLTMPNTVSGERRPVTDDERNAIIKTSESHRAGLWVLTMLYAALRPEETVPLMWSDIDLTPGNESVTVRRATEFVHNRPVIKKPKGKDKKQGKEAERTIPIPPELSQRLKEAPRNSLYVFPAVESGAMMTKTYIRKLWHSFHRDVDINMGATLYRNKITVHAFDQAVTPYYLRHTCCTDWFEKGLDLKTVQYLMGHADIKTTANIYMHFMDRSLKNAGNIIRGEIPCANDVPNTVR